MTMAVASIYASRSGRALTDRFGLRPDSLPAGGNFHPEEDVLMLLADLASGDWVRNVVICGAGSAVAVAAAAMDGRGEITVLETDSRMIHVTRRLLAGMNGAAHIVETDLEQFDKHNLWYPRHVMSEVPDQIDLLFIDGPGHFAGRTPRWPAGPELFPRLSNRGIVVLDDGRRVKEKKALKRWAEDFPGLQQSDTKTSGGAVLLTPV